MKRCLVIADDLTGAAEIAGIGKRFGLTVSLSTGGKVPNPAGRVGLTVVDTNSRNLKAPAAAAKVTRLLKSMALKPFDLVYKKTDSVLRGPVLAELATMMKATGRSKALYLPQNPSRGRIVAGGIYSIDGTPLHLTQFADDPQHPAKRSDIASLIGDHPAVATRHLRVGEKIDTDAVHTADATSTRQLTKWASHCAADVFPAGGADFFEAILKSNNLRIDRDNAPDKFPSPLFICGTVTLQRKHMIEVAKRHGVPTVVAGTASTASAVLPRKSGATLLVGPETRAEPAAVERDLIRAARTLMRIVEPRFIFVEGGATTAALCKAMHWTTFKIVAELAPGIVAMREGGRRGLTLIVKPGSYEWPRSVMSALR